MVAKSQVTMSLALVAWMLGVGCILLPACTSKKPTTQSGSSLFVRNGTLRRAETLTFGRSDLEEPFTDDLQSGRVPADGGPVCLKDRLALTQVKSDISNKEREKAGTPLNYVFNGIDLSRLPAPQGQLIRYENGAWIPSSSIDYAGCTDIPCAFNRIWGVADDSLEGYLVYWWYLDMGYVIGAAKAIPGLSLSADTTGTYRDYLFQKQELELFWRLSRILPDAYRSMPTLRSMHRLGGVVPASWSESTCGDAGGTKSDGYIRLQTNCLSLSTRDSTDQPRLLDFGYIGVTHEMSHRLDVSRSGRSYDSYYLSEQWSLGFAPLSGWRLLEGTDPSTGAHTSEWQSGWKRDGSTSGSSGSSAVWVREASVDDFVRSYAATSPVEDFADTAAYFRMNPNLTREKSPRKYDWISQNIYGGRKFDPASRSDHYLNTVMTHLEARLAALVDQCVSSPAAGLAEARGSVPDLAASIELIVEIPGPSGEDSRACLRDRIHQEVGRVLTRLRATEFEACDDITQSSEPGIRRESFTRVQAVLPSLIARQAALAPIVEAQRRLRTKLIRELDPREAWLMCRKADDSQACYQQSLRAAFDRIGTEFSSVLGDEGITREWTTFSANWTWDHARTQFVEAWARLTSGVEAEIREEAGLKWAQCTSQNYPAREQHSFLSRDDADLVIPPLLIPYSGGTQYIDLRLLECLNARTSEQLSNEVTSQLRRLGITSISPELGAYLEEELALPAWVSVLDSSIRLAVTEVELRNRRVISAITSELSSRLVSSASQWVGTTSDGSQLSSLCAARATAEFSSSSSGLDGLDVRFNQLSDLVRALQSTACRAATSHASVQSIVVANSARERAARADEWRRVVGDLRSRLRTKGEALARSCVASNPGSRTSPRVQARRRDCLRSGWVASVVTPAKQEWLQTPAVRALPFAATEADTWLQSNGDSLQGDVVTFMGRL